MKVKVVSLAVLLILSACGSDNDQAEKEVGQLPVVQSDTVDVIDDETVLIDVLSNDSVSSGELTITGIDIEPLYGSAIVENNKISYTPNKGYAGLDTLTYSVNNGQAIANVDISVFQSLTLSGQVIESTLLNADVNVQIGDETVTSQVDSDGYYELDVKLNSLNDILTIRAQGHESNKQESIELMSHVGVMQALLEQAGDDRMISSDELSTLKLSVLSTASYLHAIVVNNNQTFIEGENLSTVLEEVSTEALINTAGFIQLLIQDNDYSIEDNATVLSLLSPTSVDEQDSVSVQDHINEYLRVNDLLNGDGLPLLSYQNDLALAIDGILADTNLVGRFTTEMLEGITFAEMYSTQSGWLPQNATSYIFNKSGKGLTASPYYRTVANFDDITWQVKDGRLIVEQPDSRTYAFLSNGELSELVDEFSEETLTSLIAFMIEHQVWALAATIEQKEYIHLIYDTDASFKVVTRIEKIKRYSFVDVDDEDLSDIEALNEAWSGEPLIYVMPTEQSYSMLKYRFISEWQEKTLADLQGDWVLPLVYPIKYRGYTEINEVVASDRISISDEQAQGHFSPYRFTASIDDGILKLVDGNIEFIILPFMSLEKELFAQVKMYESNELQFIHYRKLAKFDDSYKTFTDNLVTELPQVKLANINSYYSSAWENDKLLVSDIYGYQFKSDGTVDKGIEVTNEDYFVAEKDWTWSKSNNHIDMVTEDEYMKYQRNWEVISVDEKGRTLILEYTKRKYSNGDIVDEGYYFQPRINIITQGDLSHYEQEWQNTLDRGGL
ncbi:Ig-like domain-containing protein [uncultured Shewanella sp.]|uniref:Ig-like domain-containing protein n=1 Tax=uncultured Shewanella sp. TaxID=173975 RepID=UPI002606DB57|nr:Ig-like domain-containing protein [uncultured Shewanella sp.]